MDRNHLLASIVKIMRGARVIGTGFVVSANLIATCAHVIEGAGVKPGQMARVKFLAAEATGLVDATVVPEFWRERLNGDIAFLHCDGPLPSGVRPVKLDDSGGLENKALIGYGFPEGETKGLWARILVLGKLPGSDWLQLQSHEITDGYSGGPLFDEECGAVVGMIQAIRPTDLETGRQDMTAFAIPVEALRSVCSELLALPEQELLDANTTHLFLGEAGFERGNGIVAVGIVLLENPQPMMQVLEKAKDDCLHDQHLIAIAGVEHGLRRWGFRYQNDAPDVRAKFIDVVSRQLFEAYVCGAPKEFFGDQDTDQVFAQLFRQVVADRLRRHNTRIVLLHVPPPGGRLRLIQDILKNMALEIRASGGVFTQEPEAVLTERVTPCQWAADYVCALVKERVDAVNPTDVRNFERIRSKVRLVHRIDTNRFFNRRDPLP